MARLARIWLLGLSMTTLCCGGVTTSSRSTPGGMGGVPGGAGGGVNAPRLRRGINLGNRLDAPNEGDWGPVLHATDFPLVATRGFDHVRLPVRWSAHAAPDPPYDIDAPFFARVDWAIDQALDNGLSVVLDVHHYDDLVADPTGQLPRFLAIWSQIAKRYRDRPSTLAFELYNEPHDALDALWNATAAQAIDLIRQTNPGRLIIVDGPSWAAPRGLAALSLPADPNLIASVHVYEPSLFTFQGQPWMGPIWGTTGVLFPGPPPTPITPVDAAMNEPWAAAWFAAYNSLPAADNPAGPATVNAELDLISDYASRTGVAVYNGEWGAHNGGDLTSRKNWMRMVRVECERRGIGWAVWDDQTGLKLFDTNTGTWQELSDALFP